MLTNDRANRTRPSRRAVTAAGVATLAFSLIISIAPAIAASPGNAGTVKIHDATTDQEASEQGNEPWVCEFWVGFSSTDSDQAGTWQILSWQPTGDGSVAEAGNYDTSGDGVDATDTMTLPDGHYRLEWQAADTNNAKHKTFWVACDSAPSSDEATPTDEAAPSNEATPTDEAAPSNEATPSDQSTPSDEAVPSNEAAPGAGNSGQTPESQVKGGNPESGVGPGATGSNHAPAQGGESFLPDTAIPVSQSGVLAAIGVLLIIAAHAGTRRERQLPTA
jgi:hypothetical protein